MKTSGFALGYQHFPLDLADVNAWKIMFDPSISNERRKKLNDVFEKIICKKTTLIVLQVEDSKVGVVKQALKKLQHMLDRPPGKLKLDFFSQSNFIGLFVQQDYYKYLTDVTTLFVTELKKSSK